MERGFQGRVLESATLELHEALSWNPWVKENAGERIRTEGIVVSRINSHASYFLH